MAIYCGIFNQNYFFMNALIEPRELNNLLEKDHVVLVDARSGPEAKTKFAAQHLKSALHVDLENELSDKKSDAAEGGRHPLPSPDDFALLLGKLGIDPESNVVIYDDKNGANAAARFWWMLKAIGHKNAQVINGGFAAAIGAGFPTADGEEKSDQTNAYPITGGWLLPLSNMKEVESVSEKKDWHVIDVREEYRYNGESEPIDLVAGHIPGAENIPYLSNLDESGWFKSPEDLKEKYAPLGEQVIVHCGSGVTACHTLLAFAH
ncbi:MAG: sulfurtransferase, partial [Gemmatimonadaceae bacterium]|nr:sulfurtransferase [Chitinophagaceae bacterium]